MYLAALNLPPGCTLHVLLARLLRGVLESFSQYHYEDLFWLYEQIWSHANFSRPLTSCNHYSLCAFSRRTEAGILEDYVFQIDTDI